MSDQQYQGWVVIQEFGTDYEGDLLRDRLDDAGIPAVVLTQRDHAHSLNVGTISSVKVMVPPEYVEKARELIESEPFTDEELTDAALSADPDSPAAHDDEAESLLDSGNETLRFVDEGEDDDEEEEAS